MSTIEIPVIDPGVKYVGVSKLRDMNASKLKDSQDTTYVLQENDKPLAVLLSFERYLIIQQKMQTLMNTLELLGNKEEQLGVVTGIKEVAAGQGRSLSDIKAALKKRDGEAG